MVGRKQNITFNKTIKTNGQINLSKLKQTTMETSVKQELAQHILDLINDGVLTNENKDDWHFHAFNEDYYIIGYYEASEWLKSHDIDAFEAISTCIEYEKDNFGECTKVYDNSETTVNMLVYIYGEELIYQDDFKKVKHLKRAMKEIVG